MRYWKRRSALLVATLIISTGCTGGTVVTHDTMPIEQSHHKLLIATQQSRFKTELVTEIRAGLSRKPVAIRTIDIRQLAQEDTSQYNGILLVNKCMAGRPDPRVEAFIDGFPAKHKIIVLTTGVRDSWTPEKSEVDAMTSASVLADVPETSREIIDKLLSLLQQD